jgi:hypothetical protein
VGAEISLSFNTDLDAEVLGRVFRLTDGEGEAVDGDSSWSEGARMLRYRPASPLAHGGEYTVTIADGLEDRYGNRSRSEYEWSFRVEPDVDAPRIAGVFPRDGALAIPVTPSITVGFTEAIDPGTLDGIQVIDSDGQPVEISTTWDEESRTALLSPGSPLEGSADYRVTVSAVRDLAGNALEAPSEWSFSTVATPGEGPAVGMASEGDAPRDGRPVGMAGTPDAAAWDGVALAGPELVLDFLENAGGALTSSPQRVRGEGSATGLTARGGFDLGMNLSPARTAVCGFSQSVAMGLQMLAGGRTVDGDVRLSGGPEGVEVALEFDQGTIAARTESPGQVTLIAPEPGTVRVEVRAATLELRLDQGDFSCPGLMNFGFTLSDAR